MRHLWLELPPIFTWLALPLIFIGVTSPSVLALAQSSDQDSEQSPATIPLEAPYAIAAHAVEMSERFLYAAAFDQAESSLYAPREQYDLFTPEDELAMAGQLSKVRIFRRLLWNSPPSYRETLDDLLPMAPALEMCRDANTAARFMANLAWAYLHAAERDSALAYYDRATTNFDRIGASYGAAGTRAMRIMMDSTQLQRDGDTQALQDLIPAFEREIEYAAASGNQMAMAYNQRHLAAIYLDHDVDLDRAYELYDASLKARESINFYALQPASYYSLGEVLSRQDQPDRAVEMYASSIQLADRIGFLRYQVRSRLRVGDLYVSRGDTDTALGIYGDALGIASEARFAPGLLETGSRLFAFVLVHSPLVGPATWSLVAEELRESGYQVVVPALTNPTPMDGPYWQHHADAVAAAVASIPPHLQIVLVGHSGAGPTLPVLGSKLDRPVSEYIFVDADLPRDGSSRLDLFDSADEAQAFREAASNGLLPVWSDEDLRPSIVDDQVRARFVAELMPMPLPVYEEPIPVPAAWPDAPGAYLDFSDSYARSAAEARSLGWQVLEFDGTHFHMLNAPDDVADALLSIAASSLLFVKTD